MAAGGSQRHPELGSATARVLHFLLWQDALQQLAVHGSGQLKKPLKIVFDGNRSQTNQITYCSTQKASGSASFGA